MSHLLATHSSAFRSSPFAVGDTLTHKLSTLFCGIAVSVLVEAIAPRTARAQFAVIVHPAAPVSNVSVDELRRYFLGKSTTPGTTRLQVVEHPKSGRLSTAPRRPE